MPSSKELFLTCPYFTSQKVLASKWSLFILHQLTEHESVRFNELLRLMPDDMTHPVLSRQLKALVEAGIVTRRDYGEVPPRVEYSLSPIGEEFRPVGEALGTWGEKYITYRKAADESLEA